MFLSHISKQDTAPPLPQELHPPPEGSYSTPDGLFTGGRVPLNPATIYGEGEEVPLNSRNLLIFGLYGCCWF